MFSYFNYIPRANSENETKSNRMTAIPPTSTKGLPEPHHAMKDAAKPLPGHPRTDEIDDSAKLGKAQSQVVSTKLSENQDMPKDAPKPIPGHGSPEKVDDSVKEGLAQLQEVSTKLSENQHMLKDTTKPIPGNPSPEKVDDSAKEGEAQIQEVSTKLSENQDKSMFQQISTPMFTMPHSATARVLDTNCTCRKIEFHNSNGQLYVTYMQLRMANLTKSPSLPSQL